MVPVVSPRFDPEPAALVFSLLGRDAMSWRNRLQQMVLAGGALFAGCKDNVGGTGGFPGVPCGNASPDPCICGRPEESAAAFAECQSEKACNADGGIWVGGTYTDLMGVTHYPYCQVDGDAGGAPGDDGGSDGNGAD
jgi:hypothetical protein